MRKYSYAIIITDPKTGMSGDGTGFFIRKDFQLYLITAKHVITGCDSVTQTPPREGKTSLFVFIEDEQGFPSDGFKVDIAQQKKEIDCRDPDIIAIKVPPNPKINSVESFLYPEFPTVTNVEIYGFPGAEFLKYGEGSVVYSKASNISIKNANDRFGYHPADTFNTIILGEETITDALGGFSGSPISYKGFNFTKMASWWGVCSILKRYDFEEKSSFDD